MTADELAAFLRIIERRFGLRMDDRAAAMAEVAIKRAAVYGEPIARYLERVDSGDAKELRALVTDLTVGETYFFRHAEQFHAFADVALPERLAARGRIRVLSAGCSSGEEAYTMAMLTRERVPDPRLVSIHGIDLNPVSLERARRAKYSRWALRAIPPELEQRWFTADGRDVELAQVLRSDVEFALHNLNDEHDPVWTPETWDIVFCRNVLMYFAEERARAVLARITRSLAPGGFLFLGHAESLRDRADLDLCHTHATFYYQRPSDRRRISPPSFTSSGNFAVALDAGWFADIKAATDRVNAIVDGALAAVPAPEPVQVAPVAEIRELFAQERFAEALARLAELPPEAAHDRTALLLRALALTHAGRLADAETASCELLALEPSNPGGHYLLALCRDSAGDPSGASRHAKRAGELDPSFAMARVQLGLAARRAGDRELAKAELVRAIALLEIEDSERLALFGGGFSRQALIALCRAELAAVDRSAR